MNCSIGILFIMEQIDYVLDELDGYAEIADSERGIEVGSNV